MIWRVLGTTLLLSGSAWAQSVVIGSGAEEQVLGNSQVWLAPEGIQVQSGGSLVVAGSLSGAPGTITSGVIAGVPISVAAGGTIDLKFAKLESITTLAIASGAKILRVHDTIFTDLLGLSPGVNPWIDLSLLVVGDRGNLPFSFNRVTFDDSQNVARQANITSGAGTPLLRMLGNSPVHGNRWGEAYDNDSANVVLWHSGAVSRTGPSGNYDTVEDALKASETAATSTLTVTLGQAMIDDVADFNTVPSNGASASGPTLVNACLAPMVGKAVLDSDGDSTRRGKIVNCIVARGTAEETTAVNCTFFDPSGTTINVSNIAGTNCLIENGGSSGNDLTRSAVAATAAYFTGATGYDFHLVSPDGNPAIDEGTVLTQSLNADLEGTPRGADGKAGGFSLWDIGAFEYIAIATPVITTPNLKKTNDNTPIVIGTASPNVTITVYFNGMSDGVTTADGSGAWTYHGTTTKNDATYTITAVATNGTVTSFISAAISLTVDTICAAPLHVTATPKNTLIDIEWTPSPDADVVGYRIYRSVSGGAFTLLTPSDKLVTGTKYRDGPGLTNGVSYAYKVAAVDNALNEKH